MNRLGLDIGKKRIGIAISRSPLAGNYETLYCKTWTKDISHIAEIVSKENIDEIVVGLPLNMDGTEGEMAEYVKKFCGMLKSKILANSINLSFETLCSAQVASTKALSLSFLPTTSYISEQLMFIKLTSAFILYLCLTGI